MFRSLNGGALWTNIFQYKSNKNIYTGWRGETPAPDDWQEWWWGPEPLGFNVCPSDPQRVAVTDLGFIHITTNGGAVWSQAYVHPADENNANALTPAGKAYHTAGLENTAVWSMEWESSNCIIGCFTDIHGTRSTDGGATWTFPTGLVLNTMYDALAHPTNHTIYAGVASVHNMYVYEPYLQDAYIDGGTGMVVYSRDCGLNWTPLPGVRYPVIDLAVDPNNLSRMYILQVNSANGGIYVSDNFQQGAGTTWRKLTNPPRTQGHPYRIHVLKDGTLVCAFSGRINGGDFTDSSGVFVSTDGGTTWADRTAPGMRYYTMDLTIDPHDAAQNTWYAGVYSEDWNSLSTGGLYRTQPRRDVEPDHRRPGVRQLVHRPSLELKRDVCCDGIPGPVDDHQRARGLACLHRRAELPLQASDPHLLQPLQRERDVDYQLRRRADAGSPGRAAADDVRASVRRRHADPARRRSGIRPETRAPGVVRPGPLAGYRHEHGGGQLRGVHRPGRGFQRPPLLRHRRGAVEEIGLAIRRASCHRSSPEDRSWMPRREPTSPPARRSTLTNACTCAAACGQWSGGYMRQPAPPRRGDACRLEAAGG